MVSMYEIERYAREVGELFDANQVILFGSYAYGKPDDDSDVDLLVVMETQERPWRAASRIRQWQGQEFPLDLLVRTPRQIQESIAAGDCFVRDIVSNGRVLYETRH